MSQKEAYRGIHICKESFRKLTGLFNIRALSRSDLECSTDVLAHQWSYRLFAAGVDVNTIELHRADFVASYFYAINAYGCTTQKSNQQHHKKDFFSHLEVS